MSKKKKKKKYRGFWFFVKLQILLMVMVLGAVGYYFFGGYGAQVSALKQEADGYVRHAIGEWVVGEADPEARKVGEMVMQGLQYLDVRRFAPTLKGYLELVQGCQMMQSYRDELVCVAGLVTDAVASWLAEEAPVQTAGVPAPEGADAAKGPEPAGVPALEGADAAKGPEGAEAPTQLPPTRAPTV